MDSATRSDGQGVSAQHVLRSAVRAVQLKRKSWLHSKIQRKASNLRKPGTTRAVAFPPVQPLRKTWLTLISGDVMVWMQRKSVFQEKTAMF